MKKTTAIALVLLLCALLLGAGGGFLLLGENTAVVNSMTVPFVAGSTSDISFCDPILDPTCLPPPPR